jgi:hypothetical protein
MLGNAVDTARVGECAPDLVVLVGWQGYGCGGWVDVDIPFLHSVGWADSEAERMTHGIGKCLQGANLVVTALDCRQLL